MASSKEFHDYIMDQLSRIGEFSSRKMMGEYCLYYKGKMFAEICDNMLLLKPLSCVLERLPDAERVYPYEGSKTLMVVAERIDDLAGMKDVFDAMYDELPAPKAKKQTSGPSKYGLLWQWICENGQESICLSFEQIKQIAGVPIDHSFLKYKKELNAYGWHVGKISMKQQTVAFEKGTE